MPNSRPDAGQRGAGKLPDQPPRTGPTFVILVVCTGNVSRSPTGQILLQTSLTDDGAPRVESAGTRASAGSPIDPEMQKRLGGQTPLAPFGSRHLDRELVSSADLILGMTREHCAAAVQLVPSAVRSTFTLEEFAWLLDSLTELDGDVSAGSGDRLRAATPLAESRRVFFRLGGPRQEDIPDPIGRSAPVYDRTFERISRAVATISEFATPAPSS